MMDDEHHQSQHPTSQQQPQPRSIFVNPRSTGSPRQLAAAAQYTPNNHLISPSPSLSASQNTTQPNLFIPSPQQPPNNQNTYALYTPNHQHPLPNASSASSQQQQPLYQPSPSLSVNLSPPATLSPSTSASASPTLLNRVNAFRSACLDVLYGHQTHNLIPHSSKVVIFDSKLQVQHAFDGLVTHDINCAPVWDSTRRKYVGMLSVSDFLDILLSTAHDADHTAFLSLSQQRLCDWTEFKKRRGTSINRLLCISPESTLHEAVRQLLNYRVHRLCVVQLALADTILRILTNHGILRFLRQSCPLLSSVSIRDLGIGVFKNLLTLTYQTPILRAMEMLSQYKVSSIPIVDADMRPIDVYSRSDVRYLAADHSWTNLDMTIEQALANHRSGRILPLCTKDDSLMTVSGLLVSCAKHSLICVDPTTGIIEGVVSLTDIFSFILNTGPPIAESRIAALKADLEATDISDVSVAEAEEGTIQQLEELQRRGLNPVTAVVAPRVGATLAVGGGVGGRGVSENSSGGDDEMGEEKDGEIPPDEDFTR